MRKRTGWLVALAVTVALCGGLCIVGVYMGTVSLLRPNNAHALDYGDQIEVRGGYQRIDSYDGGEGSCECDLTRWYMGPANADPRQVFEGPGLSLAPWPGKPINDKLWDWLAKGDGYTRETGSCLVSIHRLRREADPYLYPDLWHLSQDQISGWTDGSLDVFELSIICDRDTGESD